MSLKFKDFNAMVNPHDGKCYVALHGKVPTSKGPLKKLKFNDIVSLASTDPLLEIGWIVQRGFIIIDIDDRITADIVLKMIQDRNEQVMVVNTTRGIHIYARSDYNHKTTNNILACGATADTVAPVRGNSYITTSFKNPVINTSPTLAVRNIVYYNGIEDLPFWLTPIFRKSKKKEDNFITYPLPDARNDCYNRHLWRMKISTLTADQRKESIELINEYVAVAPLTKQELEDTMLRDENNEDLPQQEFFNEKGHFLHHKTGQFLIDYLNIKKDVESNLLFHYNERKNIYQNNDEYLKGVITHMVPSLKDFEKNEVIKFIGSYLEMDKVLFDSDPYRVNFKNGVLDILTLKFTSHSPLSLDSIQLNCDYNPDAYSAIADEFFETATCGCKDTEQLLYESIGYSMLKTAELQKGFILVGEGRNGKSTFLDLIKELLGPQNTAAVSMKALSKNFRLGGLHGKLASLSGDISNQPLKESDLLKEIIAGDTVQVEEKYEKAFEAVLYSTMFYGANELPRTPDTSDGFYRRWTIVPFNADLKKVSKVKGAKFRRDLLSRESVEYVAYKAVQAIYQVLNTTEEFTEPDSVVEMKRKYRIENHSVLLWASENDVHYTTLKGAKPNDLYMQYSIWGDTHGYKCFRSSAFENTICKEYGLRVDPTTKTFVDK